jgi:hypothetical protein
MRAIQCIGLVQLVVFNLTLQPADLFAGKKKSQKTCGDELPIAAVLAIRLEDLADFPQEIRIAAQTYGHSTVASLYEQLVRTPAPSEEFLKATGTKLTRPQVIKKLLDGLNGCQRQLLVDFIIEAYFRPKNRRGALIPEQNILLSTIGNDHKKLVSILNEMEIFTCQQFWVAFRLRHDWLLEKSKQTEEELSVLADKAWQKFKKDEKTRLATFVNDAGI